jgi:cyanophycinase
MRFLILFSLLLAGAAEAAPGSLVIAGGALRRDNVAVFRAFIYRVARGKTIAVIPAASGSPRSAVDHFRADLGRHDPNAIARMVRIAVTDDPDTRQDESTWRANAYDPEEIANIERAGGIWFTGGDQARIVEALKAPDGSDTPMLVAIRRRLAEGAVIGGTSAGAAIMSGPMILQGDSLTALIGGAGEKLAVGRGLGFLPLGIVDQHFDARARLGRLTRALADVPQDDRIGFGIDENMALVVDLATGTATAAGPASVTIIDARAASFRKAGRFGAQGLRLSVIGDGDRIDLATLAVTPTPIMRPLTEREQKDVPVVVGGGMAVPAASFADMLGEELMGNRQAMRIDRLSFGTDRGVIFRFARLDGSRAWWGDARYTVTGIAFDIVPVSLRLKEAAR